MDWGRGNDIERLYIEDVRLLSRQNEICLPLNVLGKDMRGNDSQRIRPLPTNSLIVCSGGCGVGNVRSMAVVSNMGRLMSKGGSWWVRQGLCWYGACHRDTWLGLEAPWYVVGTREGKYLRSSWMVISVMPVWRDPIVRRVESYILVAYLRTH
jgi:hypothetical protein